MQRDPTPAAPDAVDMAPCYHRIDIRTWLHIANATCRHSHPARQPLHRTRGLHVRRVCPGRLVVPEKSTTIPNVSSQGGLHFQPHFGPLPTQLTLPSAADSRFSYSKATTVRASNTSHAVNNK